MGLYVNAYAISADYEAPSIKIREYRGFSIQGILTSTSGPITGNFRIQISNNGSNWDDLVGTVETVSDSATYFRNISNVYYTYARLKFTRFTGTATLTAYTETVPF